MYWWWVMMKLDNKGYLVIEVVLSSVVAFVIMYFLIELTFNLSSRNDDLYKEITFINDKNVITKNVMDDVSMMQVSKLDFSCTTNNVQCVDITYNVDDDLEGSKLSKRLEINKSSKLLTYGVYDGSSYNKDYYYYEKKVSDDLDLGNVSILNKCFGSNVSMVEDDNSLYVCNSVDDDSDVLNTNGLFTIKFNATSKFLDKDYGINITIPYNNLEVEFNVPKCFDTDQSTPSMPYLAEGMIPVKWSGNKLIKADSTNSNNDWYDYANGKWANVVLVNNNRSNYINAKEGTILEDKDVEDNKDIVAYYVWIPRYSYKLFSLDSGVSSLGQMCISFEDKNDSVNTGSEVGQLYTHPAFTFGSEKLSGIWVSKFRTTGWSEDANGHYSFSNPKALLTLAKKPTLISRAYVISSLFSNYLTDTGKSKADAHLIKNTDWGAVAYLTYSSFGVCSEDGCQEIATNNNNKNINYISNVNQSTTGTVYGIYNMKSSSSEFVMGNFGNIVGHQLFYPNSSSPDNYNYSNFKGQMYTTVNFDYSKLLVDKDTKCVRDNDNPFQDVNCYYDGVFDTNGNYLGVYGAPIDFPDSKYYDLYEIYDDNGNIDNTRRYILGDATYEVRNISGVAGQSWLSDFSKRQGFFTFYVRGNSDSMLYYTTSYGSSGSTYFRSVIVEK